jgi:hypothetical protein
MKAPSEAPPALRRRAGVLDQLPEPGEHASGVRRAVTALQHGGRHPGQVQSPLPDPWCQESLRRDLLPDRRVVVRFDVVSGGRKTRGWLLIERDEGEICRVDPGFGDDLVVTITDPLTFARWHVGLVEWGAALRSGAIQVSGPPALCRALPTWNAGPDDERAQAREARADPSGHAGIPAAAGCAAGWTRPGSEPVQALEEDVQPAGQDDQQHDRGNEP